MKLIKSKHRFVLNVWGTFTRYGCQVKMKKHP